MKEELVGEEWLKSIICVYKTVKALKLKIRCKSMREDS